MSKLIEKIKSNLESFWVYLITKRKDIPHLNVFWRITLFPFFFIWFLVQLFIFSYLLGHLSVLLGLSAIVSSIFSKPEDSEWDMGMFIILPIIAPLIWLFKYFYLGEFNTLMNED